MTTRLVGNIFPNGGFYHQGLIPATATRSIQRLPLSFLRFFPREKHSLARPLHYIELMGRPENAASFPGVDHIKPSGDGTRCWTAIIAVAAVGFEVFDIFV